LQFTLIEQEITSALQPWCLWKCRFITVSKNDFTLLWMGFSYPGC